MQGLDPGLIKRYYKIFGQDAKRILDLGCGIGDLGKYKPSPDVEVFGLDKDERKIEVAKEYEKTQVFDLERGALPFEDEYFDGVLLKDILEHLFEPWVLLKEVHRVIKYNGIIIISVPMPKPKVVWGNYTHIRGFTKDAIEALLEDSGFKVQKINRMGGVPLAARLRLVRFIPKILKIPIFGGVFSRSWEVIGSKKKESIL